MVSYAPPGGSVGAHVDNYDVFLVQGRGRRSWEIEALPRGAADEACEPNLAVRVLSQFMPSFKRELSAGDALYLPPRFAHHGISTHPTCLTYSVGFRAPSAAEALQSFATFLTQHLPDGERYTDAGIDVAQPGDAGAISPVAVQRLRDLVRVSVEKGLADDDLVEQWVGCLLTGGRRSASAPNPTLWLPGAQSSVANPEAQGDIAEWDEAAKWEQVVKSGWWGVSSTSIQHIDLSSVLRSGMRQPSWMMASRSMARWVRLRVRQAMR
jgi:ribosomal protein L16 Arg81 hydroxylase